MNYLTLSGLLLGATLAFQCSPDVTNTAEPLETSDTAPSPAQTPDSSITTSTLPANETPTHTPSLTQEAINSLTPAAQPVQTPAEGEAQLKMVLIRAKSSLEVETLRRMHLDIIRVKKVDSKITPDSKEALLQREFIIEAVVTPAQLAKLKSLGFEVTETP